MVNAGYALPRRNKATMVLLNIDIVLGRLCVRLSCGSFGCCESKDVFRSWKGCGFYVEVLIVSCASQKWGMILSVHDQALSCRLTTPDCYRRGSYEWECLSSRM